MKIDHIAPFIHPMKIRKSLRIPPIPDYSCEKDFHYLTPKQISVGDVTKKYGLNKKTLNVKTREIDDFCPRKQLENLVTSCGCVGLDIRYFKIQTTID